MNVRFWYCHGSLTLSPRCLLEGVRGHTDTPMANRTCFRVRREEQWAILEKKRGRYYFVVIL